MTEASARDRHRLLVEIARCPLIAQRFGQGGGACAEVIDEQWPGRTPGASEWAPHHLVPEPWSGHIATAPILFVASNPSTGNYTARLDSPPPTGYPTVLSSDQATVDYFEKRFEDRIVDGVRNKGETKTVRFWKGVLNIANDLLPERTVRPGIDYALTELVRCKSTRETGVRAALATCTSRYLEATLEASSAPVIVATGAVARDYFRGRIELRALDGFVSDPVQFAGRERRVALVPHPSNQRGLKYLISDVAPEAVEELRDLCAAAIAS